MRSRWTRLVAALVVAGMVCMVASTALLQMGTALWLVLLIVVVLLGAPVVAIARSDGDSRGR